MKHTMILRTLTLILCVTQIGLLTGCGGGGPAKKPEGTVTGTLTSGGTPLPEVMVNFQDPTSGSAAMAKTDATGKYTLNGPLVIGSYKVFITPAPLTSTGTPGGPAPTVTALTIPDKYKSLETTDLMAEVKAGDNTIPLDAK